MIFRIFRKIRWWPHLSDRIIFITQPFTLLWHLTLCGSPVSIKLVEMSRARFRQSKNPRNDSTWGPALIEIKEDHWFKFLFKPMQLLKSIKQYHCADNRIFIFTFFEYAILSYLGFKAIFHRVITGSDEALVQYYSERYFPRIYESNPSAKDLEAFFITYISYTIVRRLVRLYALIKNSIINRNGYKRILVTQLNLTCSMVLAIPKNRIPELMYLGLSHRKDREKDPDTRSKHLGFDEEIEDLLDRGNPLEFVYFRNPIDFDSCYGDIWNSVVREAKPLRAKDWFVAVPLTRMDPTDFFFLVFVGGAILIGAMLSVAALFVFIMTYELCALAYESEEYSCLMQIPLLFSSLSRFIRVFDLILLGWIQVPIQFEAAKFITDGGIFISRINKLTGALKEDLHSCHAKMGSQALDRYSGLTNLSEHAELNRLIWFHVQLIRCIHQEFRDLTDDHTASLNVLLVGGGLFWSLCVTKIIKSQSFWEVAMLGSFVFACAFEMIASIMLCVAAEKKVSIELPLMSSECAIPCTKCRSRLVDQHHQLIRSAERSQ